MRIGYSGLLHALKPETKHMRLPRGGLRIIPDQGQQLVGDTGYVFL